MSKAEELARHVIHEWEDYALGGARVHEVVSELRRLVKVEAEHAALLKAISDAEPDHFRAVLADDQKPRQIKTSMHVVGIREKQAADAFIEEQQTFYGWNYTLEPLYTLNGIKKP